MAVGVVCTGVVFQEYVYAPVPPDAVTVAEPVAPPKQLILVCEVVADKTVVGSVITTCFVLLQPFESVTVTV